MGPLLFNQMGNDAAIVRLEGNKICAGELHAGKTYGATLLTRRPCYSVLRLLFECNFLFLRR
jgi:hypothetical protein